MAELQINDDVPQFSLPTDGNQEINISDLKGKNIVIYFYPKDDTPGCTIQAKDFTSLNDEFKAKNTKIIGISKDSVARHDKFKAKYGLNFTLASDEDVEICNKFGVWIEKSMYGRKYMGIDRSTFLISADGKIQKIWRKVKVKEHAQEVLDSI